MRELTGLLEDEGFAVVPYLLSEDQVCALLDGIATAASSRVYAMRNLLSSVPAVAQLATSPTLMRIAQTVLGKGARPVKGTLFDKTRDANWLAPWHQDLTICVDKRVDADGYGPWTIKAGVHNVQPPVAVLERMLAIRVHLDDCDEHNGALRVLPGTHKFGPLKRGTNHSRSDANGSRDMLRSAWRSGFDAPAAFARVINGERSFTPPRYSYRLRECRACTGHKLVC